MINRTTTDQLEDAIDAFERSWTVHSVQRIEQLLDEFSLSGDRQALVELLRVDVELRYRQGSELELDTYLDRFDCLREDASLLGLVAYEDYRSRLSSGYSIDPARWQRWPQIENEVWFQRLQAEFAADVSAETHLPHAADRVNRAGVDGDPAFEAALDRAGFRLVQEIGQGAMSRVYLATQSELAGRYVVLKIVSRSLAEPQSMARLQHTNIVPIYSFHQMLSRSVICMPYAGRVTLAEFLSGRHDVSRASGQSLVTTVRSRVNATRPIFSGEETSEDMKFQTCLPAADDQAILKPLEQLSSLDCNQLAIWIFSRLASALAHSHARGVLHNDLKPGNVLIRNDGEPALLDFNLAQSLGDVQAKYAGGTLPYMSPETYRALMGQECKPRSASDIYGIGVMLFEFVTGRLPFQPPSSIAPIDLQLAIDARKKELTWDAEDQVSPGLRAIISRCLAFAPERRYESAEDLREDLDREYHGRSLVHTTEPRGWRVKKWVRRHAAATSAGTVLFVSCLLLAPLGYAAVAWKKQSQHLAAVAAFNAFSQESTQVLAAHAADPERSSPASVDAAIKTLDEHGLFEADGIDRLLSSQMTAEQQQWTRDAVLRHVVQLGLSESERLDEELHAGPLPEDQLIRFRRLYELASRVVDVESSRAVSFLAANLARFEGDQQQSRSLRSTANDLPIDSDAETYLEAIRLLTQFKHKQAQELLAGLADRNAIPPELRWTNLGRSQFNAGEYHDAMLSFTQAIQRSPQSASLQTLRGHAWLLLREGDRAEADFTKAIELEPTMLRAWINRGIFRRDKGRYEEAIADLSQALVLSPGNIHALVARARAYREAGLPELGDADLKAAVACENLDVAALRVRSLARSSIDPEGALEDLQLAIQKRPYDPKLFSMMGDLLSRQLDRVDEAISMYSKSIEFDPSNEATVSDRAVLLARVGRYEEAERDIESVLPANAARTLYQAACASALIPEQRSRVRSLSLLAQAIQTGYKADRLETDPDLDALREMPGFQAITRSYQLSKLARRRPVTN